MRKVYYAKQMQRKLIFSLSILFGAYLLCFQSVSACLCYPSKPPCGGVDKTRVVFVGKVVKISFDTDERNRQKNPFVGKKAQFEVTETLNNTTAKEITVETGLGGGDCGFDFKEGEEYLVYASEDKGRFFTSICSRTALLPEAQEDLEILRQLKSRNVVSNRLFGRTVISNNKESYKINPLPKVKITATNSAGKSYETITDDFGSYHILDLPNGKYGIKAIYKDTFVKKAEIVIDSAKGEKCAEEGFYFRVGGTVTGRIVDAEGKPVAQLKVYADRLVFSPEDEKGTGLYWGFTNDNGEYEIDGLQKGKYIVSINYKEPISKETPFPPTFYPNGSKIEQAEKLIVTTDKSLDNLDFRLPSKVKPRLITGIVLFPDGKPARGARVEVKFEDTSWRMDMADVDAEGKFTLSVFDEQSYYFFVYNDSAAWDRNKESQKILIPKTGAIETMKITVPFSKTLIINKPKPKSR